ncbi:MAG: hypothetical protein BGO98_23255 [Myxococcales bacterium 68-20]|nr:hypothetical protein [Myxococcales bacterium]OJY15603.1 MAG: hypothetical protein BGO98_23255 [Myxococcales bacterium 68-20]
MLGVLARKRRPLLLALTLACGACGLTAVGTSVTNERTDSTDASTADADSPDSRTDAPVVPKTDGVPPLVVRLDINGPTHVGVEYEGTWTAAPVPDGGCGPSAYTAEAPLSNTKDAPLFAGEAYGSPLVCAVGEGLAPGMYRVVLYFAEVYWGPGCPGGGGVGSRVFDVLLEGKKVLSSFDVFAVSGGCMASTTSDAGTPIVRSFDIAIEDGRLDIEMPATADNGKLSALELFGPL